MRVLVAVAAVLLALDVAVWLSGEAPARILALVVAGTLGSPWGFTQTLAKATPLLWTGAAVALALLMAFNIAGISMEERRREYATMFAYGLPVRSALRIAVSENLIIGVLGTVLGLGIGVLSMSWITGTLMEETWPEIGIESHLSAGSIGLAVLVGVVVVALTPLVMPRRLTRMDIPSTLRVVE